MTDEELYSSLARSLGVWESLVPEFNKEYMKKLLSFIKSRRSQINVYPGGPDMFRAFKECPEVSVKVVIIGQDPYSSPGVADGLAFSTRKKCDEYREILRTVPSLAKILEHIDFDLRLFPPSEYTDLSCWARQGVLLLNSSLTVEENRPLSHKDLGWEIFIKNTIEVLNKKEHLAWLLIGSEAQTLESLITNKHLKILNEHPAFAIRNNREWNGNKCFSTINKFLISKELRPIIWNES